MMNYTISLAHTAHHIRRVRNLEKMKYPLVYLNVFFFKPHSIMKDARNIFSDPRHLRYK